MQPTSEYAEHTQKFVERTGALALPIAKELGISSMAIVGAVANEYDTRGETLNWIVQYLADRRADWGDYKKYSNQKIKPVGGASKQK